LEYGVEIGGNGGLRREALKDLSLGCQAQEEMKSKR